MRSGNCARPKSIWPVPSAIHLWRCAPPRRQTSCHPKNSSGGSPMPPPSPIEGCLAIDNLRRTMRTTSRTFPLPLSHSLAAAALLLPLGCGKAHPPAEEEEHPSPVKAAPAEKKLFGEWTELVGTTMALPERGGPVTTLVEGRVTWLLGQ